MEEYYVNPICEPKSGPKMEKNLLKLCLKTIKKEKKVKRGVKDVTKSLRKGVKGICVLASDVSPIDVYSHIPILCEENSVPYVFVSSRVLLGMAAETKRPTSLILIQEPKDEELNALYNKYYSKIISNQ